MTRRTETELRRTRPLLNVLAFLYFASDDEEFSAREISDRCGLTMTAVYQMLAKLRERGYLTETTDEADEGRFPQRWTRLSDEGVEWAGRILDEDG